MDNQIKTLTKAQVAATSAYVDKWVKIGLNTDRFTQTEAEEVIHPFQRVILQTSETPVLIFDNPRDAWVAVCEFLEKEYTPANVLKVQKIIADQTYDREILTHFLTPYQEGSFFASVFGYYDFFLDQGIVTISDELMEKYKVWENTAKLGLIYPLPHVCIVSQKPSKVLLNENGLLHSEHEAALQYVGWECGYYLNGIAVPKELALTPSSQLSMDLFTKASNPDVRAEFVRKYGIGRMLEQGSGKKIDSYENYDQEKYPFWWSSEYEMWDMAELFEGLDYQPCLKMLNGTTGIWDIAPLSPNCHTLEDAIKERMGGRDLKIVAIK